MTYKYQRFCVRWGHLTPHLSQGHLTLFLVLIGAFCIYQLGISQTLETSLSEPWIQVTTLPGNETSPALSPDGKWLAFVSDQEGNQDIWVISTSGGVPKPLVSHPAADFSPTWTPDGKALVFVSTRDDALGDLWWLSLQMTETDILPSGKPKKLTSYLGKDVSPAISPDGKLVAFTSLRKGQENIWVLNLKKKNVLQVTFEGGREPSWFPDSKSLLFTKSNQDDHRGNIFAAGVPGYEQYKPKPLDLSDFVQGFPTVSPEGKEMVWVRITRDTNGDGILDWSDKSSLWKQAIDPEARSSPTQITLDTDYALYPQWGNDGWIYYSSNRGGGINIWKVPASSPIPSKATAQEQFNLSQTYLAGARASVREPTIQELELSRLCYQKVIDDFPDSSLWCARAWYRISQLYGNQGLRDQQTYVLRRILRFYADFPEIAALAEVDYQVILWRESMTSEVDTLFTTASAALVDNLRKFIADHPDQERAISLARLAIANAYYKTHRDQKALNEYLALRDTGKLPDIAAEAQMQIAGIFEKFGQGQEVIPSYLKVVQDYPDEVEWNRKAIDRILILSVSDQSGSSIIEGLQKIVQQYREVPNLAAAAELRIGQELYRQGENDLSLLELERLEGYRLRYPNQFVRTLSAEARLLIAKINLEQGNTSEAITWFRKVTDEDSSLAEGSFSFRAKSELLGALISHGERLEHKGDYSLALAEYHRAVKLDSSLWSAWQGMIRVSFLLNQLHEMSNELEQALQDKPESPVLWYGMGLLLSYKNQNSYQGLLSSNQWLLGAIARQPSLTPAYVTLGFNYLGLDELSGKAYKRSFLKTMGENVNTLIRLVTFRHRPQEIDFLEQAINILRSGIAVNDESTDSRTEARLLINLGNAYYRLGEFGFGMAASSYQQGITLDSTFQSITQETLIRERLGHCLIFTGRFAEAAGQLERARHLYVQMGDVPSEWRVLLRLGELYMFSSDHDHAADTFTDISSRMERVGESDSRALWLRNRALQSLSVKDWKAADQSAVNALAELDSAQVFKKTKVKNYLKFKVLGLAIPLINFGPLGTGTSKTEGFTEQDEWELNQSIRESAAIGLKDHQTMQEVITDRLWMAEFNNDLDLLARLTYQMGVVKFRIGEYQKADSLFKRTTKLCLDHTDIPSTLYGATRGLIARGNLLLVYEISDFQYKNTSSFFHNNTDFIKRIADWESDLELVYNLMETKGTKGSPDEAILTNLHGCLLFRRFQFEEPATAVSALRKWELVGQVNVLFEKALSQATATKNVLTQAVVEHNLGWFYIEFNDIETASEHLKKSYQIAVTNQLTKVLWRTEYALAELSGEQVSGEGITFLQSKNTPQWIQESLEVLESTPVEPENYEELQGHRYNALLCFDLALDQSLQKHDQGIGFLETAERRNALVWLWAAGAKPFAVKQETQKFIWGEGGGIAPFLQKEIQRLSAAIRAESEKEVPDQKTIASLTAELQSNSEEYQQVLDKVWKDDPEFGSLFSLRLATVAEVQAHMDRQEAILRTILHRGKPYSWIILPDTLFNVFFDTSVDQSPILKNDTTKWTWILDPALLPLSRDSLASLGIPTPGNEVSRVGDFRSYLIAKSKLEVPGNQGIILCQESASSNTDSLPDGWKVVTTSQLTSSQALEAISNANVIYLDLPIVGNISQPLSSYFDLGSERLYFYQLFSKDLSAMVALVRWNVKSVNGLQQGEVMNALFKGLMFTGIPSVVMIPNEDMDRKVIVNFGQALLKKNVATIIASPDNRYHDWILLGSPGMDSQQISTYAQENFKRTIQKGNLNLQEGNTEWATRYYQRARQMAVTLNQKALLPNIDQLLLKSAYEGKRWQEAEDIQLRFLEVAEANQDQANILSGWKNLAVYRTHSGEIKGALAAWDKVLAMAKESDDRVTMANANLSVSDLYRIARKVNEAIQWADAAYQTSIKMGRLDLKLTSLVQKAKIQFEFDQVDSSLSSLRNAEALLDSIGTTDLTSAVAVSIYEIKGRILAILGQYSEALSNTQRALESAGSDTVRVGYLTQRMADLYWESGRLPLATQWAHQADSLFQQLGDRSYQLLNQNTRSLIRLSYGDRNEAIRLAGTALEFATDLKDSTNMATITRNMGLINLESRQPEQAILRFQEARNLDARLQRTSGLAHDLANLGLAFLQAGRIDSASVTLSYAVSWGQPLSDRRPEVKGYLGLALVEQQKKNYSSALEMLVKAQEAIQNRPMGQYLWRIWQLRAQIYQRQNKASEALQAFEQAMEVLEGDPVASGNYHPTGISMQPVDPFDRAVVTALALGDTERAFLLSDRKRRWLRDQPFQLEGFTQSSTIQSDMTWDSIRQKIPEATVLLSYHVTPDTAFLFIATPQELKVRGIIGGDSVLEPLVEEMRTAVEKILSVDDISKKLYQALILPVESRLSSAKRVYIMPDGCLWSVPFGALIDNDNNLFIDRFPIAYIMGLDRIAKLESNQLLPFQKLIAFAYPKSDVVLEELVYAEREVRRIALQESKTIPLIDDRAGEVVLDTIHTENNAVHFACHGWSIPDDPLSVGIVMKADATHDGIWTAREISNKSLKCPLVFLNLCPPVETLNNRNQIILSEAFMEAGATKVISTLWKVEDLAAAVTAKTFYRYLREQVKDDNSELSSDKEMDALRGAQIQVRDKVNAHPVYWAGYTLQY